MEVGGEDGDRGVSARCAFEYSGVSRFIIPIGR